MPILDFQHVDIIFGDKRQRAQALTMLDNGGVRSEILKETGAVLGVADASISVKESDVCVLMGLSGSGKSTLLRAVNGLNEVTRGSVLLGGGQSVVDVANCKKETLRQIRMERVAMVFQQFALLPWRTVAENVGLGLELRGLPVNEINRKVDEKLDLVQLTDWRDKKISQLSGGMQQRVGLARAFATDADILLMDEPFSALDPLIRSHLQDELLTLQKSLNKTIVFVSHDLDEALKIGTHIAIMEEGRIVQFGTPQEIVLNPANDYVARFVAHMNPLNIMTAASLMTKTEELKSVENGYWLDAQKRWKLSLNKDGTFCRLEENRKEKPVQVRSLDTGMRDIIKQRHETGSPVILADGEKIVGVVGDDEIYSGILNYGNG